MDLDKTRELFQKFAFRLGLFLSLLGFFYQVRSFKINSFFLDYMHFNPAIPLSFPVHLRSFFIIPIWLLGIILLSLGLSRWGEDFWHKVRQWIEGLRPVHFLLITLSLIFLLSLLVNLLVLQSGPTSIDEVCYMIQANLFARFKLWGAPPPIGYFPYMGVYTGPTRMFGGHFLGQSLLLAPAIWVGLGFLTPSILSALLGLVFYIFFREVFKERYARWGLVLLALSPLHIFMSAGYLSHTSFLLFLLLSFVYFARYMKERRGLSAFYSGFFLSFSFFIRPLDALPFFIVLPVMLLYNLFKEGKLVQSVYFFIGLIFWLCIFLYTNYLYSGSPFTTPMAVVTSWASTRLSPFRSGWGLSMGINQLKVYTIFLCYELFGWGGASLLFATVFLLIGGFREKGFWFFCLSVTILASIYLQITLLNKPAAAFGPRYFYSSLPFLILITLYGIDIVVGYLKRLGINRNAFMGYLLLLMYAYSLFSYVPVRCSAMRNVHQNNIYNVGFPTRDARDKILALKKPAVVLLTDIRSLHALYYLNQRYPDLWVGMSLGLDKDIRLKVFMPNYKFYYLRTGKAQEQSLTPAEWDI